MLRFHSRSVEVKSQGVPAASLVSIGPHLSASAPAPESLYLPGIPDPFLASKTPVCPALGKLASPLPFPTSAVKAPSACHQGILGSLWSLLLQPLLRGQELELGTCEQYRVWHTVGLW